MPEPSDFDNQLGSHHRREDQSLAIDPRAKYRAYLAPNGEILTRQMEELTRRSGDVQEMIRQELFARIHELKGKELVEWIKSESLAQRAYKLNQLALDGNKGQSVEDFIRQLAKDP